MNVRLRNIRCQIPVEVTLQQSTTNTEKSSNLKLEEAYVETEAEEYVLESDKRSLIILKYCVSVVVLNLVAFGIVVFLQGNEYLGLSESFVSGLGTIVVLLFLLKSKVWRETLLIIPSTGVQFTQTSVLGSTYFVKFLPASSIKGVLINEAIVMQHVITYLAIVWEPSSEKGQRILPVFRETLPKLFVLEEAYNKLYKGFLSSEL